jgi:hypothetical protein
MDERIRTRLLETSTSLSLYSATAPSEIEKVFNFQAAVDMEATDSQTLSRYTIMLAQYLITLQVRFNTARVIAGQKKKVLDRKVAELLKAGVVEGKTLKEREANAVASTPELQQLELDYDEAAAERDLLEGLDKPITELINALKAEVRRRAEERQYVHRERA